MRRDVERVMAFNFAQSAVVHDVEKKARCWQALCLERCVTG
jgi:hypothetical protein